MNKMTRREILRRLAGISVLGVVGTAVRATVSGGSRSGARPIASHAIEYSTQAPLSRAVPSPSGDASISADHANHASNPPATTVTTTQATTPPPETTSPTTSSSTTATSLVEAPTSSASPVAAVGTSELSGVLGPTVVLAGTVAKITGDLELRGDLVVEGLLTSVDSFTLRGNGFQIEIRNGGQLDLRGVPKSGWVRGAAPSGWQAEDRIVTAPTEPGRYALSDFHNGSPSAVSLADGRAIVAEQFNLSRSITIDNVARIMFHMGAGRQVLKHLSVTNSGVAGQLGFYPVHFHLNGNTTRGSIVEGVVVENGRFRAFVPHGSHGVTFLDCVAFNTAGEAYWWDLRPTPGETANDSHDTIWQHCLAAYVFAQKGANDIRLTGFFLGNGSGNRCIDCTAVAVQGGQNSSGFHWPEKAEAVWEFRGCVAHNNTTDGIFAWQNNVHIHQIQEFIAYRCGRAGIENGAYLNNFQYIGATLTDSPAGVISHALTRDSLARGGPIVFENVISNGGLVIGKHRVPSQSAVSYRSCRFTNVVVNEVAADGGEPGMHELIDSQLEPSNFDLAAIHPASTIRISEGGRLLWEWSGGGWRAF